jgi:hypothetical protein
MSAPRRRRYSAGEAVLRRPAVHGAGAHLECRGRRRPPRGGPRGLPQEKEPGLDAAGIFATDIGGIDWADGLVAIIDGADPDSGTSWEIGYAYGRGKPIVVVRTDFRDLAGAAGPYNPLIAESATIRLELPAAPRPRSSARSSTRLPPSSRGSATRGQRRPDPAVAELLSSVRGVHVRRRTAATAPWKLRKSVPPLRGDGVQPAYRAHRARLPTIGSDAARRLRSVSDATATRIGLRLGAGGDALRRRRRATW